MNRIQVSKKRLRSKGGNVELERERGSREIEETVKGPGAIVDHTTASLCGEPARGPVGIETLGRLSNRAGLGGASTLPGTAS